MWLHNCHISIIATNQKWKRSLLSGALHWEVSLGKFRETYLRIIPGMVRNFCGKYQEFIQLLSLFFPSCKFPCGKHREGAQGFVFLTVMRKSQDSEVKQSWVWIPVLLFLSFKLLSSLILDMLVCQMGITIIPSFRNVVRVRYDFIIMANTGSWMVFLLPLLPFYIIFSAWQPEWSLSIANHIRLVPWWKASPSHSDLRSPYNGLQDLVPIPVPTSLPLAHSSLASLLFTLLIQGLFRFCLLCLEYSFPNYLPNDLLPHIHQISVQVSPSKWDHPNTPYVPNLTFLSSTNILYVYFSDCFLFS